MPRINVETERTKLDASDYKVTCVVCGKTFEARRGDAAYCSPTCRSRAHRAKLLPDAKVQKANEAVQELIELLPQIGRNRYSDELDKIMKKIHRALSSLGDYTHTIEELDKKTAQRSELPTKTIPVPTLIPPDNLKSVGRKPSPYQQAILDEIENGNGDIMVVAAAGSGKTTTLIQANKIILDTGLYKPTQILNIAFNQHIAAELSEKLKGLGVVCRTVHSLGLAALTPALSKEVKVNGGKYSQLCKMWIQEQPELNEMSKDEMYKMRDTLKSFVDLARLTLTDISSIPALLELSERFALLEDEQKQGWVLHGISTVIRQGEKAARDTGIIDFTDMLWLPVLWDLKVETARFVLADEAQDFSALQRKFILKLRDEKDGRFVFVGDPNQAIMGFAGADVRSFYEIKEATGAKEFPLSICYRCPELHVQLAQEIVPEIECSPSAKTGVIEWISEGELISIVKPADMVICRMTAPLVSMALKMMAMGKPAKVRGQDGFGKGLAGLVDNIVAVTRCSFNTFASGVSRYIEKEEKRLANRSNGEQQLATLKDKTDSLLALYNASTARTVQDFQSQIEALFEDDSKAVIFSTVHRAKGLEANRVFILAPSKLPLTWQNQKDWETEQEMHIRYVALTRAKESLYFVKEPEKKKDQN